MIPAVHNALTSSIIFKGRICQQVQPAKISILYYQITPTTLYKYLYFSICIFYKLRAVFLVILYPLNTSCFLDTKHKIWYYNLNYSLLKSADFCRFLSQKSYSYFSNYDNKIAFFTEIGVYYEFL